MTLALLSLLACFRPTDSYDVRVHGQGALLDEIAPEPQPMGGQIEYARYRLWGTNLGFGVTGFGSDQPRADGRAFVSSAASFGYPRDPGFDRNSAFVSPGPPVGPNEDGCFTRVDAQGWPGISEYVDVGDHIALTADDGATIRLERDPSIHPRPAGESWYVGYGSGAGPVVQDHPLLPDTWRSGADFALSFPGTLQPPESNIGAVPYPVTDGAFRTPPDILDLAINGEPVRPPQHDEWLGVEDDVRFAGPWHQGTTLTWTPSTTGEPLTVQLRYLASGVEVACSEGCADCGPGFHCEEGWCTADEGSGWNVLGDLTCTVADDGEFTLTPEMLQTLDLFYPWEDDWAQGAVLVVARVAEGELEVPDVLTWNGRKVPISPVRTRAVDAIVTRLEIP